MYDRNYSEIKVIIIITIFFKEGFQELTMCVHRYMYLYMMILIVEILICLPSLIFRIWAVGLVVIFFFFFHF